MATIDIQINASADDATEGTLPSVSITLDYCVMGAFGGWRHSGYKFNGITIPSGQQIDVAYITFTAQANDTGDMVGTLYGDDEATPGVFETADADDITTRPRTDAGVTCGSAELGGDWTDGTTYNSPSIVPIVGELYASYDYSSGAAMAFVWIYTSGDAERLASSWNWGPEEAAWLHIEYSEGAPPVTEAYGYVV